MNMQSVLNKAREKRYGGRMNLKDAIYNAKHQKSTISSKKLSMYEQTAKSLLHWMLEDYNLMFKILTATDWEADKPRKIKKRK